MLSIRNQLRVTTSKSGVQEITAGTQRRPRKAAVISETANMYAHGSGPANNSMNVSVLPQGGLLYDTMLSGLLGENEQQNMRFYRDIYYYDTVAGACVDLMSTMPFSPFTITECETSERTGVYRASVAALNLEGLLPEMTMDRLVTGQCARNGPPRPPQEVEASRMGVGDGGVAVGVPQVRLCVLAGRQPPHRGRAGDACLPAAAGPDPAGRDEG